MGKLSDHPGVLIDQALRDLEKIRKDPHYVLRMGRWHEPIIDEYDAKFTGAEIGTCAVCLAGCVMSGTLKGDRHKELTPIADFHNDYDKLVALDLFRTGEWEDGLKHFGFGRGPCGESTADIRARTDLYKILPQPQPMDQDVDVRALRRAAQILRERLRWSAGRWIVKTTKRRKSSRGSTVGRSDGKRRRSERATSRTRQRRSR